MPPCGRPCSLEKRGDGGKKGRLTWQWGKGNEDGEGPRNRDPRKMPMRSALAARHHLKAILATSSLFFPKVQIRFDLRTHHAAQPKGREGSGSDVCQSRKRPFPCPTTLDAAPPSGASAGLVPSVTMVIQPKAGLGETSHHRPTGFRRICDHDARGIWASRCGSGVRYSPVRLV